MSTRGAAARDHVARPQPSSRPRPRPAAVRSPSRRRRFRIRLGLLYIPLVALLFAGVVYINSKELALVKRQGEVARQTARIQEQLALTSGRQAKIDATVRARAESMGMISPSSDAIRYIAARPAPAPTPETVDPVIP